MPFNPKTKKEAFMVSEGKCAICHMYPIMNYHHINPEAQSQDDSFDNCLPICSNCHEYIQTGGITQANQKIIRNIWYENVDWKSSDIEKNLLEKSYTEEKVLERIDENIGKIKKQFDEYIVGISSRKSSKVVADSASKLATTILATGSYYTFVQVDKGEGNTRDKHYAIVELDKKKTIEGFRCPFCKNPIDFERTDESTILCPKCGMSLEPVIENGK